MASKQYPTLICPFCGDNNAVEDPVNDDDDMVLVTSERSDVFDGNIHLYRCTGTADHIFYVSVEGEENGR
jgi:hypothetical protein